MMEYCNSINSYISDMDITIKYAGADGSTIALIIVCTLLGFAAIGYYVRRVIIKQKQKSQQDMERTGAHVNIDIQSDRHLKSFVIDNSMHFQRSKEISLNGSSMSELKLNESLKRESENTKKQVVRSFEVIREEDIRISKSYTKAFDKLDKPQENLKELIMVKQNEYHVGINEEASSDKTPKEQFNFYTDNREDISSYNSSNINYVLGDEVSEDFKGKYVENVDFVPIKSNGKIVEKDLSPQEHSEIFYTEEKDNTNNLADIISLEEEIENGEDIVPKRRRTLFS